jgi:hypothetical protein
MISQEMRGCNAGVIVEIYQDIVGGPNGAGIASSDDARRKPEKMNGESSGQFLREEIPRDGTCAVLIRDQDFHAGSLLPSQVAQQVAKRFRAVKSRDDDAGRRQGFPRVGFRHTTDF